MDQGGGLIAAVQGAYFHVARQACRFGKMANVAKKVRKADQGESVRGFREVYSADNRKDALATHHCWKKLLGKMYILAVERVGRNFNESIAFYVLPKEKLKYSPFAPALCQTASCALFA